MFAPVRQPQHTPRTHADRAALPEAQTRTSLHPQAIPEAALHNCLAAHRVLKRKSNGLPSATATYTALRKAAVGGSLLPDYGHGQAQALQVATSAHHLVASA